MKATIRRILRRLVHAGRAPVNNVVCADRVYGLATTSLSESAHVSVWPESDSSTSAVRFGEGVHVGEDVQIAAAGPGSICVGDHVSFQDRCQIYGDVVVGSYCIFAKQILVISTIHKFREKPTWLIRDQDDSFWANMALLPERAGRRVHIEEDCWLGWGSAIMPGVYIGRGAVIGANSVVTRDVAPYEVHGGAPNRRISFRLHFSPPRRISALDDDSLPYFYRGFRQRQADLSRSRTRGGIEAGQSVALVLAHEPSPTIRIKGIVPNDSAPLTLHLFVGGRDCGLRTLDTGPFEITVQPSLADNPVRHVPAALEHQTYIEILADDSHREPYLMAQVEILTGMAA
jgi:acetyltransferase-like isoleucine patch superfamily enzyme